jgi:hypothetical protein
MWGRVAVFFLGVAAEPVVRAVVRSSARGLVKASAAAGRGLRRIGTDVREELEKGSARHRGDDDRRD